MFLTSCDLLDQVYFYETTVHPTVSHVELEGNFMAMHDIRLQKFKLEC